MLLSLSPEFATEVRDLIIRPPADSPYDSLRKQLIKHTTASELQQLFSTEDLGDRKPSQLLRRLQKLMGECASTTDSTLLFLQRLPGNVRMSSSSLDDLVYLADKIMNVVTLLSPPCTPHPITITQCRSRPAMYRGHSPSGAGESADCTCWYHLQYGTSARRCKPPCDMSNRPATP